MKKQRLFRGDRLRSMRDKQALSQSDLADRLGIGQNQIYRYEAGQVEPSPTILGLLAQELGVSADWLLGLTDKPSQRIEEGDLSLLERELLAAYRRGDLRDLMRIAAEEPAAEK